MWLIGQCSEVVCVPSGQVGSVGVYASHICEKGALEQEGIEITLVSSGAYKTEANPYEPLTDEARQYMAQQVEQYYAMFIDDLAKGRRTTAAKVKADYGQGRLLTARDAPCRWND